MAGIFGDANLLTKDNIKKFLTNPSYNKIAPSCNCLQAMLACNQKSAAGSADDGIFTPEAVKKASDIVLLGFDTVSFTYAIFQAYVEIPKMATSEVKKAAVVILRAALKAKKFLQLPVALERRLKLLEGTLDTSSTLPAPPPPPPPGA